jgi:hypothetical protein|tara:strand:+ start:234 stop:686 length:453 start_codon:yes stop_codon:yes gene_type:complete
LKVTYQNFIHNAAIIAWQTIEAHFGSDIDNGDDKYDDKCNRAEVGARHIPTDLTTEAASNEVLPSIAGTTKRTEVSLIDITLDATFRVVQHARLVVEALVHLSVLIDIVPLKTNVVPRLLEKGQMPALTRHPGGFRTTIADRRCDVALAN